MRREERERSERADRAEPGPGERAKPADSALRARSASCSSRARSRLWTSVVALRQDFSLADEPGSRLTLFLRNHQNITMLAITSTATTGPAITPGFGPPELSPAFLLHWIVGHWEQVLVISYPMSLPSELIQVDRKRLHSPSRQNTVLVWWFLITRNTLARVQPSPLHVLHHGARYSEASDDVRGGL